MRFAIALTVCAFLSAQPKPAAPGTGADRQQEQTKAKGQASQPETAPATKTEASARPAQLVPTKPEENTDPNRRIADYTQALAHYTLALVIVGALQMAALGAQGFFLFQALRETRTATGLTRDSLDEVRRANSASESLTRDSNALTRDATGLTRQSVILAHRPRLIVKKVVLHGEADAFAVGNAPDGTF